MQESLIFSVNFDSVQKHQAQWKDLRDRDKGLDEILKIVESPKGKALVFAHDDPDGLTSGIIFKRMLLKKGWKVADFYPVGFMLSRDQLEKAMAENPDASTIFILDKGTLAPYDDYAAKLPVYLIDHHPTPRKPEKCVFFNPAVNTYVPCSTSVLAHGISMLAKTRDSYDDFLALVGLKGDWAIMPVRGVIVDFAKPFLAEYGMAFKNLLGSVAERPTQFDAEQREVTCLLSRIAEYVHATGGGGFQYFYHDRDASLKNLGHPECIAHALEAIEGSVEEIKKLTSLEGFVRLIPEKFRTPLDKIFVFFLQDWERAAKILDTSVKMATLEDTAIYMFVGGKVPLLPMIGSIKLFDLKSTAGDKTAQIIMASSVSPDYTHISVRGTGDRVHSGKFCGNLQDSLKEKYPQFKDFISGGGHPRAAECTIKTSGVTFFQVLQQALGQLGEMNNLDELYRTGGLKGEQKEMAIKLGLEYAAG